MDEKDLRNLLRSRRSRSFRRGWRCPDETQIAAYVDHQIEGTARESISTHLGNCDACLSQVSFLLQARDWANPDEVPADVLRRARNLVPRTSGRANWGWRWVAASATAACLLLVLAFITLRFLRQRTVNAPSESLLAQQHQPDLVPQAQTSPATLRVAPQPSSTKPRSVEPAAPAIRGGGQNLSLTVLFPRDGATVGRSELDFRWQPVADIVFYNVTVVTAAGDLIQETKTEDTHLRIATIFNWCPAGSTSFQFALMCAKVRR
jgi:hypothetical protein